MIRLTQDNLFESRATWSPDSTAIDFSSARRPVGNSVMHAINADEEIETMVTSHKWAEIRPSWSPDGRKIAFHSRPASG
ncbi:MAG: hypothetical protein OXN17_05825 [Candidatus Poribacteria bacterium]|nr:hypothetical protein [Candidatus Poribacteria bacterium]MDE0505326.1 hypothetical protein [Candidatus Poribacteria bacterium]